MMFAFGFPAITNNEAAVVQEVDTLLHKSVKGFYEESVLVVKI